jgi:hypothetical protein
MTKRQANMIAWFVLLSLTILVWAQFLPPCVFGCAEVKKTVLPLGPLGGGELKRYTCREVVGTPIR